MRLIKLTSEELNSFQLFVESTLRGQIHNVGQGYTALSETIDCFKALNEIALLLKHLEPDTPKANIDHHVEHRPRAKKVA